MESLLLILLVGLIGGIAVGLQGPLASIMTQRMGPLESSFIVHAGGALISVVPLLLIGGGQDRSVAQRTLVRPVRRLLRPGRALRRQLHHPAHRRGCRHRQHRRRADPAQRRPRPLRLVGRLRASAGCAPPAWPRRRPAGRLAHSKVISRVTSNLGCSPKKQGWAIFPSLLLRSFFPPLWGRGGGGCK